MEFRKFLKTEGSATVILIDEEAALEMDYCRG